MDKRERIARAPQPGESMAVIAQEHGINAKLLFTWRQLPMLGAIT